MKIPVFRAAINCIGVYDGTYDRQLDKILTEWSESPVRDWLAENKCPVAVQQITHSATNRNMYLFVAEVPADFATLLFLKFADVLPRS